MAMQVEELLRPLTYRDLEAYDDPLLRYEIINGELVVSPAPALDHGQIVLAIYDAFRPIIRAGKLGRIWVAPGDVELGLYNTVQPDLFFIARERLKIAKQHVIGSPDLAIEVVSPSSRSRDYIAKRVIYEEAGVKEYWIVDPMKRSIDVLVLENGRYVRIDDEEGVARSTVVPGVAVEVVRIFDALND
jgi:Uma2 family endonuclease